MKIILKLALLGLLFSPLSISAADDEVEEVVVTGSQIKGAKITGALPVSILSEEDIDAIGISDGDELVNELVEQGINYFNENEFVSGGVNAARGDIGAYNLRNMGVGNTLTLLNGRRLVNNAGYQTEWVGGDYVPTMTVNSNSIPTNGLARLEVLKDGASAIYGADAVAGVVNNVLDADFEGLRLQLKGSGYRNVGAKDVDFNAKYGATINEGKTNVSVFFSYRDREGIALSEDPKWLIGDYRYNYPGGLEGFLASPWGSDKNLRNLYTYQMAQLDMSGTAGFTDSRGETQLVATGHPACQNAGAVDTGFGSCMVPDFETRDYPLNGSNPQALRDYRGEMERTNVFVYINHELENGVELFSELGHYSSSSQRSDNNGSHKGGLINLPADYYWSAQIPGMAGKKLRIDGWRPNTLPRTVNVEKDNFRFLLGLRGTTDSNWDWESAVLVSESESHDVTSGRINYEAFIAAINDPTSAAFNIYNPDFSTNNGDRIQRDVRRDDVSELTSFDFKVSNDELIDLPAGPMGALVGVEVRKETYEDDRDPYLDGTYPIVGDNTGSTYTHPYTSGVQGSSPTEDVYGDKTVKSVFAEFQIPITDKINAQAAIRHETFSDSDSATVGKIAFGYDVTDWLLMRASASSAFRAPNLIQVNQEKISRTGTRIDALMRYVGYENGVSKSGTVGDYDFTIIRFAEGAEDLKPEESTNTSFGIVVEPPGAPGLTFTYDVWEIEKENTIGLFGRNNQGISDLLLRIQAGNSDCSIGIGNGAVIRDNLDDLDDEELGYFDAVGLCPAGRTQFVKDEYLNLATRTLKGKDLAIYYDFETVLGDFAFTYADSRTTTFHQTPTGRFNELQAAFDSGVLPSYLTLDGFGDLLGVNGFFERKDSLRLRYSYGNYGASVSALRIGHFKHSKMKLSDGTMWDIPSMITVNASFYYKFDVGDKTARVKLAVKNVGDERAPLADGYNGFYSDVHSDLGRNYYLDFRLDF